jgi:uncharacterized coiled-coil protein SlyX
MSHEQAELIARLDGVEMRVAHQDRTISELNEVITSQWARIDMLERQLLRLREDVQNMAPAREGPEPPPPHY